LRSISTLILINTNRNKKGDVLPPPPITINKLYESDLDVSILNGRYTGQHLNIPVNKGINPMFAQAQYSPPRP